MLIIMKVGSTQEQIDRICAHIREIGLTPHPMSGPTRCVVGVTGNKERVNEAVVSAYESVLEIIHVSRPYKLSAREGHVANTVVDMGEGVKIGGEDLIVMAGPCSIESLDQAMTIGKAVREAGATVMRGGAFKPRTSPFSFQGLEEEGFRIMDEVKRETGLKFVTEAVDPHSLELIEEHADMIQIGARNMQNFALLKLAARCRKPVLLKRGISATLDELLMAADYVLSGGNENVVLCERGIRTYCKHTRNTLDLNVVPVIKSTSHLPVIVDPSHGTGKRDLVSAMALAGVACGADGIIVEVHNCPEKALSDGEQSLTLDMFNDLMPRLAAVGQAVGRGLAGVATRLV